MSENAKCTCCGGTNLIFSCSGAADTAEITDRAARLLNKNGVGKMFCLAGIGGRVNPIVAQTETADKILVIDGCHLDCARKTLEEAGLNQFIHLRVTDMGMEKGKSPVTDENIALVIQKGKELLA